MKTYFTLILLLLAVSNCSYSQTTFGPKAGINISNIHNNLSEADFPSKLTNKRGYYLGVFAQKEFDNSLILRTELFYSLKGASFDNYVGNYQLETYENLHYINFPLLIGFRPIRHISLMAENISILFGAELGYLFEARTFSKIKGEKRTGPAGRIQIPSGYNPFDKALTLGVSYNVNTCLTIEARYNYGFKNIFSDLDAGANRVAQFGMVYHFLKPLAKTGKAKLLHNPETPRYSF